MIPYQSLARQICETGRLLHDRGYIAATEGNISARIDPERILCTPTMVEKGALETHALCIVDLRGRRLSGHRLPSSELPLHLELYRGNPRTQAVVHCHPPYATAAAVSRSELPRGLLAETEYSLQDVPVVPYAPPGSAALAAAIAQHAVDARCALLRNHGAVSWGHDLVQARWWMEMLEAYCRTLILARPLGGYARLSDAEIDALRAAGRQRATDP